MGEKAAESGRALTPRALRFSPKSNGPESSFHSGKTALLQTGERKEDTGHWLGVYGRGSHKRSSCLLTFSALLGDT